MTDEFSMYTQIEILNNRKVDNVIKAFNRRWIQEGPGRPTRGVINNIEGEIEDPQAR